MFLDVTHVAVKVPSLRDAESYYRDLFGLEVAWRDSDGAASMFATWEEMEAAGVEPEVVMLWRGSFRLALAAGSEDGPGGAGLDHVGLQVSPQTLDGVRERVRASGAAPPDGGSEFIFNFADRYGVRWELDTRSFEDPVAIIRQKAERLDRERAGQ